MEGKKEDGGAPVVAAASTATSTATSDTASSPNVMPVPKIKHDWYQTEALVIVTVLVKNLKKDDVKIDFTEKTVSTSYLELFSLTFLRQSLSCKSEREFLIFYYII